MTLGFFLILNTTNSLVLGKPIGFIQANEDVRGLLP